MKRNRKRSNRIVIVVSGGVVQSISADHEPGFVYLIDYDNIKEGDDYGVYPIGIGKKEVDLAIKEADAEVASRRKVDAAYNQWVTICPQCKERDTLIVAKVRLLMTGQSFRPMSRLCSSGFVVDPLNMLDLKDQSTSDEEVICVACRTSYFLNDLGIKKRKRKSR